MKRISVLLVTLAAAAAVTHSAPGSLGEEYGKAALSSVRGIEEDISTSEQAMKSIFDPVNAAAKTEPEKSMTQVLHRVYEQKLSDNRLRKAEFEVLDESLNSPSPLLRDYISREQIGQYDHDDAEMNRRETACFESLKHALQNHVSEIPKPCAEWAAPAAAPEKKSGGSEE